MKKLIKYFFILILIFTSINLYAQSEENKVSDALSFNINVGVGISLIISLGGGPFPGGLAIAIQSIFNFGFIL